MSYCLESLLTPKSGTAMIFALLHTVLTILKSVLSSQYPRNSVSHISMCDNIQKGLKVKFKGTLKWTHTYISEQG